MLMNDSYYVFYYNSIPVISSPTLGKWLPDYVNLSCQSTDMVSNIQIGVCSPCQRQRHHHVFTNCRPSLTGYPYSSVILEVLLPSRNQPFQIMKVTS